MPSMSYDEEDEEQHLPSLGKSKFSIEIAENINY
jgi:hypothetical protein